MLIRIVKMQFKPENRAAFQELFDSVNQKIRGFEGCEFLELFQSKDDENTFFTYSHWQHEEALENYRNSELFTATWTVTKAMFSNKPEAWSVEKIVSLP